METHTIYLDFGILGEECEASVWIKRIPGMPQVNDSGRLEYDPEPAGFELTNINWSVSGTTINLWHLYAKGGIFTDAVDNAIREQVFNEE